MHCTLQHYLIKHGQTALHYASRYGNSDVVAILAGAGADLNILDKVLSS